MVHSVRPSVCLSIPLGPLSPERNFKFEENIIASRVQLGSTFRTEMVKIHCHADPLKFRIGNALLLTSLCSGDADSGF